MNARIKTFSLLLAVFAVMMWYVAPVFAQRMPQYLELVHANSMRFDQEGAAKTTKIMGNVFFRKGKKELRCDLAIYYQDSEITVFEGNVQFQDSSRSLFADRVEYYQQPEKEIARGRVHLILDQKEINAEELTYDVEHEFVDAKKNVRFKDFKNHVRLYGGTVTYDRNEEIGHAQIKPKLVKLDSLGNVDVTITARDLHYNGKEKKATAEDSVIITQNDAVLYSQTANYFDAENRVEITGKPKVVQGSEQMSAEKIELFLHENTLERIHLTENSKMISNFLIENQPASDIISGKEIWINVKNDSLRDIHVYNQASSTYHVIEDNQVQGVNQVMGDEMEIIFEAGKVRFVKIRSKPGLSRGNYSPAGSPVEALNGLN